MQVTLLLGSPSAQSRSSALALYAQRLLNARGIQTQTYRAQDFLAEDLLYARYDSPRIADYVREVQASVGLIVATPVYKASLSAALKALLDLLPERALGRHTVLPLATGGSEAHLLAIDHAVQPILSALKASQVLNSVYAVDRQLFVQDGQAIDIDPHLRERLNESIERFIESLPKGLEPTDQHALHERVRRAQLSI